MKKENRKLAQEERAKERAKAKTMHMVRNIAIAAGIVLAVLLVIWAAVRNSSSGSTASSSTASSLTSSAVSSSAVSTSAAAGTSAAAASSSAQTLDTTAGTVVKEGDTVNIDYVGTVDGKQMDGMSTEGAGTDLTLGSNSYISGFESQVEGHKVGETFDIKVTFPDEYSAEPSLEGKEAVFNITINGVYR